MRNQIYGALVLNRRVDLHAIDATPARYRGYVGSSPLDTQVHASIRAWLATNVSPAIAKATRIQYGGSMKGANAAGLLSKPDIDGGLIGGASLKAEFISGIAAVAPKP